MNLDGADGGHKAHRGPQTECSAVAVAVEQEPGPHHVQRHPGVGDHRAAVGTVPDREADPTPFLHGVQHRRKQPELFQCIRAAVLIRLVRNREMGVEALKLQVRQCTGGDDVLHALLKKIARTEIAQPRHAGVELDVYFQHLAEPDRLLGVFDRLGVTGGRLRQVIFNQHPGVFLRRVPEDQDRHRDPAPPQLQRLVQAADRQVLRTLVLQQLRNPQRAVPVGVGLHHAEKAAALGKPASDRVVIVPDSGEVDFRPGTLH